MKILIVEDNAVVGMDVAYMLDEWGYDADGPYGTVQTALAAMEENPPDAAILDIDLINGESSEPIARALLDRSIPFLCLTGFSRNSQAKIPIFSDVPHLEKPIDPRDLQRAMATLLGVRD